MRKMFTPACKSCCAERCVQQFAAMSPYRDLAILDAAEQLAAGVTRLSDRTPRLLHRQQVLKAVQSVSANIAEAFGRATLADRNSRLVIARGEAEETITHLRANFNCERISPAEYWPLHNRAVTIVRMLNRFLT
jgi:four helix bundle protein